MVHQMQRMIVMMRSAIINIFYHNLAEKKKCSGRIISCTKLFWIFNNKFLFWSVKLLENDRWSQKFPNQGCLVHLEKYILPRWRKRMLKSTYMIYCQGEYKHVQSTSSANAEQAILHERAWTKTLSLFSSKPWLLIKDDNVDNNDLYIFGDFCTQRNFLHHMDLSRRSTTYPHCTKGGGSQTLRKGKTPT